ncbi:sugar phosphate nucleotidyltransferase [Chloroflexota bacterium]
MKAVILIGGEGTRLRPLTCNIPKAMVPILNKTFLEHLLLYLKQHGISEVILAMGYLPDPIQSHLGDGVGLGMKITYLVEEEPLGTAGAVKNAASLLEVAFLVFNGDILTEINLTGMIARHREVKPKVSIALTPVEDPTVYGVVETDEGGMVRRFLEKPGRDEVTTNMINAGIYILEPEVLSLVPAGEHCMFENYLFPLLLERDEPILSYPSRAYWIDIGTPEKYLKTNQDLLREWGEEVRTEGKSDLHPGARISGPVLIGEGCTVAEGARLKGPAVLGPRCEIGRGAIVDGAVLWQGVRIGEEALVRNCIVGAGGCIEAESHVLDDCVIGDNVTVGRGNHVPQGTRIESDSDLEPRR